MKVVCFYFDEEVSLKSLAEIFCQSSPQIALSTRALFLEIGQCGSLYTEEEFLNSAKVIFAELKVRPRIGIAESMPLALAQCYFNTQNLSKIPLSFLKYFLSPFTLDEQTEKLLNKTLWYLEKLGLKTAYDFLNLPAKEVSSRFGALGLLLRQRLQDSTTIAWPRFVPEERIFERKEFEAEQELDSLEPVIFILKAMLDFIFLRLIARGQSLKSFEIRFIQESLSSIPDPVYPVSIELAFTNMTVKTLLQLIKDKVNFLFQKKPLQGRVAALEVAVVETSPYSPTQKDLFNPKKEENEENYLGLMNRLSLKLGESNVFKAKLSESYLPEKNWERKKEWNTLLMKDILPKRPLRLLQKPIRLTQLNGKLFIQNEMVQLEGTPQEEVIFSDWWQKPEERVYFQASTPLGKNLWIYKSQEDFYLHGLFD